MDDFGSGYSSLHTMKDIQFDELKMNKCFLNGPLSINGKIVIEEIFHMLKRTHHSIVCKGVENHLGLLLRLYVTITDTIKSYSSIFITTLHCFL